ncbi:SDR family oxidoreductase [Teredinibacter turnerae]|uniref:SDR family oxidoreductase n=1 Tax=Teredinibacter turnerae TaxID=2426 RepID=UPI0005F77FA4|nr:SDR family oxidoreductase [Teredinibacter turnerae]
MNVLILGATSAIAQAVARQFLLSATTPVKFVLVGRNEEKLTLIAEDLMGRSATAAHVQVQDLTQLDAMDACISRAWETLGNIDVALIAHGTLPEQREIERSWELTEQALRENALSHMALMEALALRMEAIKRGTIAVIGSVAGDRGRQSNYIYGAAKGATAIYAQGLRNRLTKSGVHLLTIKPGFVDTPMTESIAKKGLLWASPEQVAQDIVKAVQKKRNVIYTPGFWWLIMTIVKSVPEFIFKKLSM